MIDTTVLKQTLRAPKEQAYRMMQLKAYATCIVAFTILGRMGELIYLEYRFLTLVEKLSFLPFSHNLNMHPLIIVLYFPVALDCSIRM